MKIIVLGTGAIGTYLGGSLALDNHDVVFIERPEVAAQIREKGIQITQEGTTRRLPAPTVITDLANELPPGPFEALLFSVKSYDTAAAARSLLPIQGRLPPIISFQNGIGNEAAIQNVLETTVIGASVTTAIGKPSVGEIVVERKRGLGIANQHPTAPRLVTAMKDAGLGAVLYPRLGDLKWSKLLTNLLANATSAILDMAPGEIFDHPGLFRLEMGMLKETLQVMKARGIHVTDLPKTPVRALAFAANYLPTTISRPLMGKAVGSGRGNKMPSFHIELSMGGGKSEVTYLNGAVVEIGRQSGIPTPINQMLTEILLGLTNGEIAPEQFQRQPEALLTRI